MAKKETPTRGKRFQLYVRAGDLHTWWWACSQARKRRWRISQFVMYCLELQRHKGDGAGK